MTERPIHVHSDGTADDDPTCATRAEQRLRHLMEKGGWPEAHIALLDQALGRGCGHDERRTVSPRDD